MYIGDTRLFVLEFKKNSEIFLTNVKFSFIVTSYKSEGAWVYAQAPFFCYRVCVFYSAPAGGAEGGCMRKRFVGVLMSAAVAATFIAGCSSSSTESTTTAAEDTTTTAEADSSKAVKVGVVAPVTGGYAIYGEAAQNAVDMAVEEINAAAGSDGYTIEIVNDGKAVDDAGDSKQAVNAYNSLKAYSPAVICGSFSSSCSIPMAELAQEDGLCLISPTATNYQLTLIGSNIFRACFIDPYQGKMAAKFAGEQGYKKVAIIYAKDDDYSNGLKDAFVENAEAYGLEVVYTGECTTKDTDYTAQVSQAVASGADFLFYPCFLDTVPLLVSQARSAGFEGAIMGGDGWDGSDTTGLEEEFENTYFTNHYSSEDTSEVVQEFVQKYTEKFGTESLNAIGACYYDAIYMIRDAAEKAGGTDSASIVEGMTNLSFSGVTGTFTLDDNGDPEKNIVVNTFKDGVVSWVETLTPDSN